MRILQVTQGSDSWHAERAGRFTASEAPAMMGASKYTSRAELLRQKATGLTPEVTPQKQALFDKGHAAEAGARGIVEDELGQDLFPATAVHDEMDWLLASFDGIDMLETIVCEHKLWSEDLAAQVRAGELAPHYYWQLEQQLLVSGAKKVIFVCSDGTRERFVSMEYWPAPGRREALLAGWAQFRRDLAEYAPPASAAVEKVVAEPVEALPAVAVQVSGSLVLHDNFQVFEKALRHFLDTRLIREPKSDQDFADLDSQIKALKKAEETLTACEAQMLAQVASVDQAKRTKDMLFKLTRDNRLMAEKLLASEKERRRGEIVAGGVKALADHIAALNARIGRPYMPSMSVDFGGAIKGKKSLESMEDAVATTLAQAKIHANEVFSDVMVNIAMLREFAAGYEFLFADTASLVLKSPEDCKGLAAARLAVHKAEEQRRAEAAAERERERIHQEEAAKLRREQEARDREAARQAAQQATPAPTAAPAPIAAPALSSQAAAANSPNVVPMPTKAPADEARINLSDIKDRLHPIQITAEGLASLGFQPVATEGAAKKYRVSDFPRICDALVAHITRARDQRQAA